jgi:hypothetical protein
LACLFFLQKTEFVRSCPKETQMTVLFWGILLRLPCSAVIRHYG